MEYRDFIVDFVQRTKRNYMQLKNGEYGATALINSAVGLLMVPREAMIPKAATVLEMSELHMELKAVVSLNTYPEELTFEQIIRHVRNGIAHARMDVIIKSRKRNNLIDGFSIKDRDKNKGYDFRIELSLELIEKLFFEYSKAVLEKI